MKSKIAVGVIFVCLFATSVFGTPMTEIQYEIADLGAGRWQYIYDVYNIDLTEEIEEFTIWFDYDLYDNLTVTTGILEPPSSSWNEIVVQREPVLKDDGYYDAVSVTSNPGISIGTAVSDFSVSFDWLGAGDPGSQFYEIVVPGTSPVEVIDSGWTVPEPVTLLLLAIGGVTLLRRKV